MRLLTIKEIQAMEPGEIIPGIKGTCSCIFDRVTGQNAKGAWSVQTIGIKQGDVEILLSVWGREPILKTWKGATVVAQSVHSPKGLTGLKAEDNDHEGKVTRRIKVTGSASLALEGAGQAQEPDNQDDQDEIPFDKPSPPPPPPFRAPSAPIHAPAPASQHDVAAVKKFAARMTNGLEIGYLAALELSRRIGSKHEIALTTEDLRNIAIHISISMDRAGLIEKLPVAEIE